MINRTGKSEILYSAYVEKDDHFFFGTLDFDEQTDENKELIRKALKNRAELKEKKSTDTYVKHIIIATEATSVLEGDNIYIDYDFKVEEWWLFARDIFKTKEEAYQHLMKSKGKLFDILFSPEKHWKILSKQ